MICTIIIPTSQKISNEYIIKGDDMIHIGIRLMVGIILLETISNIHKLKYLDPLRVQFRLEINYDLEDMISNRINGTSWNLIKDLMKDNLDVKKIDGKGYILCFIDNLILTSINMFPLFGYTIWLLWISPISVIIYVFAILIVIKYYPKKEGKGMKELREIWDRYDHLNSNIYNDIIHHKSEETVNEMKESMKQIEKFREERKMDDSNFMEIISTIFNMIFIINCLLLNTENPTEIITYFQYTVYMKSSIQMVMNMYKEYKRAEREYSVLKEIMDKCEPLPKTEQIQITDSLITDYVTYTYPKKEDDEQLTNFTFKITKPICIKLGQIIRLEGGSGHGKSTFLDILSGTIPNNQIVSHIRIDGKIQKNGCQSLTKNRTISIQGNKINSKPSVYDTMTGDNGISNSEKEKLVMFALEMAKCTEFLSNIKSKSKKWIYDKDIKMSGGQQQRITIAREIYNFISNKSTLLILDEIDNSIPALYAVGIMSNIYEYVHKNNLIAIVVAHTTEVKNMKYDQIFMIEHGSLYPAYQIHNKCLSCDNITVDYINI